MKIKLGLSTGINVGNIGISRSGGVDAIAPTCVVTANAATATAAAFTATFTFSEVVTGFDATKITVVNGSVGAVSGGGTTYTSVITPTATGTVTVQVEASKVTDAAGNSNVASNTFSILYVAPAIWIDFSTATGLYQTNDTSTAVTADGQTIGYASDKSGGGNHLTQATANRRPLYKTSIQNGLSVARFDAATGVEDYLKVASITLNQPEHVYIVAKYNQAFDFDDTLFDGGSNNTMRLYRTSATNMNMYAGAAPAAVATTPEAWHIYKLVFNGASSKFGIDGGAYATKNAGTSNAGGLTLNATGANTLFAGADIAEVLVFAAEQGATPDAAIVSYLNTKWAAF